MKFILNFGHTIQLEIVEPGSSGQNDEANLTAPMPGKVLEVFVKQGDEVTEGQTLMILEAMKMEYKIVANHDGTVTSLNFLLATKLNKAMSC